MITTITFKASNNGEWIKRFGDVRTLSKRFGFSSATVDKGQRMSISALTRVEHSVVPVGVGCSHVLVHSNIIADLGDFSFFFELQGILQFSV